jgi:hypothetical protein
MEQQILRPIIEVDFLNKYIFRPSEDAASSVAGVKTIDSKLLEKFFENIDSFWHSENDQLQYFLYYNTGEYICQRKKLKYDFQTKTNYWQTYNFKNASPDKVGELYDQIQALVILNSDVKQFLAINEVKEVGQEAVFFERRFIKKLAEKNAMLGSSDWRILPDVVDTYPGEKDMWIHWRSILRSEVIRKPQEFEDKLEYLKYLFNVKYPIDPKLYRQAYPEGKDSDGNNVEYLSTEDQWVKYDTEASSDFITVNAIRALNYSRGVIDSRIRVKKHILDCLKNFGVEAIYPEYNMNRYEEETDE